MQDCKNGSKLQFIKFDFVTGGQEIKIAILVKLWVFKALFWFFRFFLYISFLFPSYFKKMGVSWCCGSHCWLVFVLWCGYCSVSFESFVLRHLVITPSATPRNYQENKPSSMCYS